MPNTLLIIGAGVDRTNGIDFPLANTLLSAISNYAENEGQEVDQKLRKFLPNLRFTFSSIITQAIEKITTRDISEQRHMIERLQQVTDTIGEDNVVKKHGELLVKLFNKLVVITQNAELDDDIESLIREVFAERANGDRRSGGLVEGHSRSLSDTFKGVLKDTLRLSLKGENNEIAQALGSEMLNIENLLIEKFLGFYNHRQSDIKNYIYISWMMWAYLVHTEKKVKARLEEENRQVPFYSSIPQNIDIKAITLNYTSFIEDQLTKENVIYFHGGLSEYVNMTNRTYMDIDNYQNFDINDFIDNCVEPNIHISDNETELQKHVIPALVPPLKLKPVLSSKYIEKWHEAASWIKEAEKIIIIGYSFSSADDHFNDIIRQNYAGKRIYIIAPDVDSPRSLSNFQQIFSCPIEGWTCGQIQGKKRMSLGNISLIKACADEIELSRL